MSIEQKFLGVANAFSTQRHIVAVRNSFYKLMPLILIASFYVLINNVIFNLPFFAGNEFVGSLKDIGDRVFRGTLGIMSLLSAFMTAFYLAESYKEEGLLYGATALGCLVALIPGVQNEMWGILTFANTSASGLFVAILVALLSTEVFRFFSQQKSLLITLPDSVPPAVAKSFSALVPILFTFTITTRCYCHPYHPKYLMGIWITWSFCIRTYFRAYPTCGHPRKHRCYCCWFRTYAYRN